MPCVRVCVCYVHSFKNIYVGKFTKNNMEVHPSIVSEIVKGKELFLIMASESAKVLENV